MTNGRVRSKHRQKAMQEWKEGLKNFCPEFREPTDAEVMAFGTGFNMGWKAKSHLGDNGVSSS